MPRINCSGIATTKNTHSSGVYTADSPMSCRAVFIIGVVASFLVSPVVSFAFQRWCCGSPDIKLAESLSWSVSLPHHASSGSRAYSPRRQLFGPCARNRVFLLVMAAADRLVPLSASICADRPNDILLPMLARLLLISAVKCGGTND